MRCLLSLFAAVSLAASTVVVVAEPAFAATTYCDGFIDGQVSQKVIVPSGASCTLQQATVGGNVIVRPGGFLTLLGANLTHSNITAKGPGGIFINDSHISGNVTITRLDTTGFFTNAICNTTIQGDFTFKGSHPGTTFTMGTGFFGGEEGTCRVPLTVQGSVTLAGNGAMLQFGGNSVAGNLVAVGNFGDGTIKDSSINGAFLCQGNTPPLTVTGNEVVGRNHC